MTTTKKKRLKSIRIAGAITVDEEVLAQKAEEESTRPESKKEIKEIMDVEILPPGSKTPKVVDRVEVTLYGLNEALAEEDWDEECKIA